MPYLGRKRTSRIRSESNILLSPLQVFFSASNVQIGVTLLFEQSSVIWSYSQGKERDPGHSHLGATGLYVLRPTVKSPVT